MYFAEDVGATDVAIAKALELRVHVSAGEGVLMLAVALPKLLFLEHLQAPSGNFFVFLFYACII
jgi:hypothetical protein